MPYFTWHDKNRAKLFNKIIFLKNQCPLLHRQKRRYWIFMMNDRYQYVNFVGCLWEKITKFHTGQRTSETKDMTHDIVTYLIYWNNYVSKCVILGKSSKHVHFIFVSCLRQKTDLSLEGEGGDGPATTVCLGPTRNFRVGQC